MEYHPIGYFVVTADTAEELAPLCARWPESLRTSYQENQAVMNQLYRQAQYHAVSQWRCAYPLAHQACVEMLSYLRGKAESDQDYGFILPRDCASVADSIDALAARRGGHDALIRHLTKLSLGELSHATIREVYIAFREALATAIELGAALVVADYKPGAEVEWAAERARIAAWQSRLANVEPPSAPIEEAPKPDWIRELEEEGLRARLEENASAMSWLVHQLCLVPEPYIAEIVALCRQHSILSDADPVGNWDECMKLQGQAQAIGEEEWDRFLELETRGQVSAWECLQALLNEYRPESVPDAFAFSPDETRQVWMTLRDWQDSVCGHDAAVTAITEKSHGHDRDMTQQTYDALYALFQYGADTGCGLIDCLVPDMG